MKLDITVDPENMLGRSLTDMEKNQMPFAISNAINKTAFSIRDSVGKAIAGQLNAPTSFTKKSPRVQKSTKKDLAADVYILDEAGGGNAPATYLQEQFFGGERRSKGIEKLLQAKGSLPMGMFTAPGPSARLNAAGNIGRSVMDAILEDMGAGGPGKYFAVLEQNGKVHPGIYRRVGKKKKRSVRGMLMFVKPKRYRERMDLFQIAQKVYARRFNKYFEESFVQAVTSAKVKW